MPYCPRCVCKLTKRKSTKSYHCLSCGAERNIMSPNPTGMSDAEFDVLKKQGIRAKKSVPKPTNNPAPTYDFSGMADRLLKED